MNRTVKRVAEAFREAGQPLYLVGGEVRRVVAGEPETDRKDFDFATPATPDEVEEILTGVGGELWTAGKRFGTIGLTVNRQVVEVTTFRSERYVPGDRHPEVTFETDLKTDLARRDFTINAMAIRVDDGNSALHDPFGGSEDVANNVLRTPIDPMVTFRDDPLRILRLIRFAATRYMEVDPTTAEAAQALVGEIENVAVERRLAETFRLLDAPPPVFAAAVTYAAALRAMPFIFGGASGTLAAAAEDIPASRASRLAAIELAGGDLTTMRLPNVESREARRRSFLVDAMSEVKHAGHLATARHLIRKFSDDEITHAVMLAMAFNLPYKGFLGAMDLLSEKDDPTRAPVPVNGDDALAIGLEGREIGVALRAVEEAMCENPHLTRVEALRMLTRMVPADA